MQWLNRVVDEAMARQPDGEIIVESGISPSGAYHMGYLREIILCDAITTELIKRRRQARHIHFVDDQDGFRKVPATLPKEYEKYLGRPLFDMPAPKRSSKSYADFALQPFLDSISALGIKMEVIRSHQKYQQGFFSQAIEKVLADVPTVKKILEDVSGRKLEDTWSPIQVNEGGYLKKRPFVSIDTAKKTITYLDKDKKPQTTGYDKGQVKLDWRLDWPARWWLLGVNVEPFGRDHATKGGSYDTGSALIKEVFKAEPPLPLPYEFINRAGESRKMSASVGTGIEITEVVQILPPEIVRFFILRSSPSKTLFFDSSHGVTRLIDEFAELLAKPTKSPDEQQLIDLCSHGLQTVISRVAFSQLVAAYQSALKDPPKTLAILDRSEPGGLSPEDKQTIKAELTYIDHWLDKWAPTEERFNLVDKPNTADIGQPQKQFLADLADRVGRAAKDTDGEWFHKAIYEAAQVYGLSPKESFETLYKLLIGKDSGPRAGWFLSILPRGWLIKRLKLEA